MIKRITIKRTITLAQRRHKGGTTEHVYQVLSLKNALEPPVGAILTPEEVSDMITSAWTVNVKEAK